MNVEARAHLSRGSGDQTLRMRTAASRGGCRTEASDVLLESRMTGSLSQAVFFFFNFIEVELIYNAVLISAVQQSNSVIHIHSFSYSSPLWFITGY